MCEKVGTEIALESKYIVAHKMQTLNFYIEEIIHNFQEQKSFQIVYFNWVCFLAAEINKSCF